MHYIRDMVHDMIINLQYCPFVKHTANIFTKTFTEGKFHLLCDRLGVKETVAYKLPSFLILFDALYY
jgi:hypothetical protein